MTELTVNDTINYHNAALRQNTGQLTCKDMQNSATNVTVSKYLSEATQKTKDVTYAVSR